MNAFTWLSFIVAAMVVATVCGAIYLGLRKFKAWIDRNTKPSAPTKPPGRQSP